MKEKAEKEPSRVSTRLEFVTSAIPLQRLSHQFSNEITNGKEVVLSGSIDSNERHTTIIETIKFVLCDVMKDRRSLVCKPFKYRAYIYL